VAPAADADSVQAVLAAVVGVDLAAKAVAQAVAVDLADAVADSAVLDSVAVIAGGPLAVARTVERSAIGPGAGATGMVTATSVALLNYVKPL